ncbi:hypothetical protein [Streptomyces sp. NPDC086989]|uniref:hypothetical protein n=1 Tax=Streptomyces sp. NPDC086989 TaxID=3365764 RepID=UPI0037F6C475
MTDDAAMSLLADVSRTLERAGFDLATGQRAAPGLRVLQKADAVTVTWDPGTELDPGGHMHEGDLDGMRSALRQALLAVLGQTGHAVYVDPQSGDVEVRALEEPAAD